MREREPRREKRFQAPIWSGLMLITLAAIAGGVGTTEKFLTEKQSSNRVYASENIGAQEALTNLKFKQEIVTTGLEFPTSMDIAPDGRIFITEQSGNVKIIENDQLLETPFLTIPVSVLVEGGLIGVKLSPDFIQDRQVFLYYSSAPDELGNVVNRVSRFSAGTINPNIADEDSEVILVDNIPSNEVHNGGGLEFDRNGMLIIGTGEAGDGIENSQNLGSLGGKVLRVNPIDGSPAPNNPFIENPEADPRIYALGFRNPFTFSVDHQTGIILALDVGDASFEEVNKVEPGKNYGWPYMEGPGKQKPLPDDLPGSLTLPLYSYPHGQGSNAITGGDVIRNNTYPKALQGMHVIGDYIASTIMILNPQTAKVFDLNLAEGQIIAPVDLDFTAGGELYFLTIAPGWLSKISISQEEPPMTTTPVETIKPTPTEIPSPTPIIKFLMGDANCDSRVNSIDSAFILQFSAGLLGEVPCENEADASADGTINAIDATLILQHSAGLIDLNPKIP